MTTLTPRVVGRFTAHVRMNDSADLLKLDQDDLQTVIPSVVRPAGHALPATPSPPPLRTHTPREAASRTRHATACM